MIHLKNWVEASQDFWPNGENNIGVECGSRGFIYESNQNGALLIAFPEAIVNFTDMQYVRPLQVDAGSGSLFEEEDLMHCFYNFEIDPSKSETYCVDLELTIKDDLALPPSALALDESTQWKIFDELTQVTYGYTLNGYGNPHSIRTMIPWVTGIRWDVYKPDHMYVDVNLEMSSSDQFQRHFDRLTNLRNEAVRGNDRVGIEAVDNQVQSLEDAMKNIILTLNWMKARMEATNFEVVKVLEDDEEWKKLIKQVL